MPSMQFTATRLRVDHDEDEPNITAGDLEIARNDRGKVSWALTIFTDEPWHHGRGSVGSSSKSTWTGWSGPARSAAKSTIGPTSRPSI